MWIIETVNPENISQVTLQTMIFDSVEVGEAVARVERIDISQHRLELA